MEKKKKSWLLKLVLVLAGVLAAGLLALWAFWFLGRVELWRMVPESTTTYIEIGSLAELFEKARDSSSVQKLVGTLGGASAYTSLAEVQAMLAGSWSWARGLADMGASICLDARGEVLILLDTQWRGVVLQLFPMIQNLFTPRDIAISRTSVAGRTVIGFSEPGKEAASWYVVYEGSIFAASPSLEQIRAALASRDAEYSRENHDTYARFADLGAINDVRVQVRARTYLDGLARSADTTGRIIKALPPLDTGVLGLEIQGDKLSTRAIFPAAKGSGGLEQIFEPNQAFSLFNSLPGSTTMASAIRVKSVEDLWAFAKEIMSTELPELDELDSLLQPLFGLGHRELLFSWPGQESALVNYADSTSPVLVLSVAHDDAFARVQKALASSVLLDVENNLVLDGIRLSKIVLPDLWKGLFRAFGIEFDLPWYVRDGNWLLLCEDPEVLSRWMLERQQGKVLGQTAVFKDLAQQDGLNADLALFYDATMYRPAFLRSIPVLSGIAGSWRYGLASLSRDYSAVRLELTLSGSLEPSLTLLPGFPKSLEIPLGDTGYQGLSRVELRNVIGGANPEIIYQGTEGRLVLADLAGKASFTFPAGSGARPLPFLGAGTFGVLGADGALTLYREAEGNTWKPSETLSSGIGPGAQPLWWKNRWLLYQDSTGTLVSLAATGSIDTLSVRLPGPVFQDMAMVGEKVLVYPRNLAGAVYLLEPSLGGISTADATEPQVFDAPRWEAGSVLASGPVAGSRPGQFLLVSESGEASAWSIEQTEALGRTVLDGPVRTQALALGALYVVLSENGSLYLLDHEAQVLAQRNIPELRGASQWLSVNQGLGMICAGRGNTLWGFTKQLELVRGFPKAGTRAWFHNINGQGSAEIISIGYDSKVYAYELPQ